MVAATSAHAALLIRRLESIAPLSAEEGHALATVPMQVADIKADQDIVCEGDRPTRSCVVIEGFTCNYKMTGEGKRQIMAFHVPGDIPDLQSLHLKVLDSSLGTITPCKVGFVQHEVLHDLCARLPGVAAALWRATLIDGATYREWVVNVGRRPAYARVAHLLCEMVLRLRAVGLAEGYSCDLPITQNKLADATGLSAVHLNRTMQELRAAGLVKFAQGSLQVLDWRRLEESGDFDPTFLHLTGGEAAWA